jgi:hypothetical protein
VLVSARETLSGGAVVELQVDLDGLQAAVERIRQEREAIETQSLEEILRRLGVAKPPPPAPPPAEASTDLTSWR